MRLATIATISLALLAGACAAPAPVTWTFAPPASGDPATGSPTDPIASASAESSPSASPDGPVLGLAAGAGAGSSDGGPRAAAAPASADVEIAGFAFGPATITVAAGGQVTWTNRDDDRHTVLVGNAESPRLEIGRTYRRSFAEAGRFSYVCGLHPSMTGTIVVVGTGEDGGSAGSGTPGTGQPQPAPTGSPAATGAPDPTAGPGATDDADDDRDDDPDDRSGHGGDHDDDDDDDDEDRSGHGRGSDHG